MPVIYDARRRIDRLVIRPVPMHASTQAVEHGMRHINIEMHGTVYGTLTEKRAESH